jgi:DMSO/TMAO reductase YedYZ molybdopterin-dependent catalytic subunit
MIHGMVDRPLVFTMDELKRLPYVSRIHFIECLGNRARPTHKTVQETHGLTSCAEWTGVPLSLLLKEAGVQNGASWIVAEGSEEVKGSSSIPLAKAMDDCVVCYGMNGEPLRPQQGFPLRLMVPGFEGIYQIKYLRRIKVVDRYYMTYDDYGHINPDPKVAALDSPDWTEISHHLSFRRADAFGPRLLRNHRLGVVRRGRRPRRGDIHRRRPELEECRASVTGLSHGAYAIRLHWKWDGKECMLMSRCTDELGTVQPTRADVAKYWNQTSWTKSGVRGERQYRSTVESRQRRERSQWPFLGFSSPPRARRGDPRDLPDCLGTVAQLRPRQDARARKRSRAWDISISPTGKELPAGQGTAKEGAALYVRKGCAGCHGATGTSGGHAPTLIGSERRAHTACFRPDAVSGPLRERRKRNGEFTHPSRRRSGITSIAACLWGKRARSPRMRSTH